MLDRSSRALFTLLVIAICASIGFTYWVTMVQKDFVIINDLEEEMTEESSLFEDPEAEAS